MQEVCINAYVMFECMYIRTYIRMYLCIGATMCVSYPVSPFLRFVSKVRGTLLDITKTKRRQQKPSTRTGGCILGTLENGCQMEY